MSYHKSSEKPQILSDETFKIEKKEKTCFLNILHYAKSGASISNLILSNANYVTMWLKK
jgi:hypothetical protein